MNCGQEFEQSRQTGERKIIRFFPSIISVFISRIGRTSTHATVRRSARLLSVHLLDPGAYFLFSKLLGSSSDSPRSASSQLTAQGRSKDKFYWGIHPLRVKCSDVDLWQWQKKKCLVMIIDIWLSNTAQCVTTVPVPWKLSAVRFNPFVDRPRKYLNSPRNLLDSPSLRRAGFTQQLWHRILIQDTPWLASWDGGSIPVFGSREIWGERISYQDACSTSSFCLLLQVDNVMLTNAMSLSKYCLLMRQRSKAG